MNFKQKLKQVKKIKLLSQKVLLGLTVVAVVVFLAAYRWIFFYQIDPDYLEHYYSFSQWSIPLSSRTMGDGTLYRHTGYQLVEDFQPFVISPEVPVLGKLLYGWTSHLTGNPYLFSATSLGLLLVFAYYLIKHHFSFTKLQHWLILLLLGSSPLMFKQASGTVLDLPQTLFLLIHVFALFEFSQLKPKQNRLYYLWLTISTLSLGTMSAIKIPVYLPLILIIDSWYLWRKNQLAAILPLGLGAGLFYAAVYAPFILDQGVIAWLKAQKWVLNFYLSSKVEAYTGLPLLTALTGWYKGWWGERSWEHLDVWTGSWAVWLFVLIQRAVVWLRRKTQVSLKKKYLLIFSLSLLLILSLLPFWPRYFVLLAPFAWILVVDWVQQKNLVQFLLIFPVIGFTLVLWHSGTFEPEEYYAYWKQGAFEEMYHFLSKRKQKQTSLEQWTNGYLEQLEQHHINQIQLDQTCQRSSAIDQKQTQVKVTSQGVTQDIIQTYQLDWTHELGRWRLNKLEILQTDYQSTTDPVTGLGICINPTKTSDWGATYYETGKLLKTNSGQARNKIMKLVPRDYCIPVGTTSAQLYRNQLKDVGIFTFDPTHSTDSN